ncbi:hypothetical protein BDZ85DRAFT_262780 [Elsinoe ampelina]|uniref:Uncharacterized protein n=1 Tax=Elsinoe ampelina TaxID=302913 RepID=A0A6A6GB84_9PEZI|nr:hypothetical protein BDZ85DRAFT_262780 [Elsinoe ampelina]
MLPTATLSPADILPANVPPGPFPSALLSTSSSRSVILAPGSLLLLLLLLLLTPTSLFPNTLVPTPPLHLHC